MDEALPTTPLVRRLQMGLGSPFDRTPAAEARAIARECFGMTATSVTRLATERDDSFRLEVGGHSDGFVLKISPPGEDAGEIDLQEAAIAHAAARDPRLPLQRFVLPLHSSPPPSSSAAGGRAVRMLHYLPGRLLGDGEPTLVEWRAVGRMLGRLTGALADFEHPAADRWHAWDLARLAELAELVPAIADTGRRRAVATVLAQLSAETLPALRVTPRQVVHNDFHGGNLVVRAGTPEFVTGILDFGDVVLSHRAADLAVAMSYATPPSLRSRSGGLGSTGPGSTGPGSAGNPWEPALALASGYRELVGLSGAEAALLPQLVLGRLAQRLLLASWLAAERPENSEYTARNLESSWQHFVSLRESPLPRDGVRQ
ncbi:phosphotransferase [Lacisediminihabitans sp. FW035]